MKTLTKTFFSIGLLAFFLTMGSTKMIAQPVNDLIENAIDIDHGPYPYSELSVDFPSATLTNDPTNSNNCELFLPGVWYKFTATSAGTVAALVVNSASAWVVFFSAPNENVTSGMELTYIDVPSNTCGGGNSKTIETTPGTSYYVYMRNGLQSDVLININPALLVSNDLIENAIDLALGPIPYTEADVNFPDATNTDDQTTGSGCNLTEAGLWYKFKASKVGTAAAGILNPNNPVVVFFSGPENATSGLQLTYIDQTNNICDYSPLGNIQTVNGTTYYIYMSNAVVSDVTINVKPAFSIPYNDLIENAWDIGLSNPPIHEVDIHFMMATSTDDNGQAGCDWADKNATWYKITPNRDGLIETTMPISDPTKTLLIFYSAPNPNVTSASELTWVDQPQNPCEYGNTANLSATAGVTYYLMAHTSEAFGDIVIDASEVLGISENTLDGFTYYPNPVTNEINLSAKANIDEVSIFNLMGQKVFFEKVNDSKKRIDLSNLQSGMYVMRVTAEGNTATYKIVKQ